MNHQTCGFLISLLTHTVVIGLAVVIGTTSASIHMKQVVIDLSILESVSNPSGPPKEEPAPQTLPAPKAPEPEKPKPIEKPKRVQKIRQLGKKVDTEPSEPKIVTPVEQQGPVPIASDEVSKSKPLTETLSGTGEQSVSGTGHGESGVGSLAKGTGGVSADALRKKYLSEHFAYIKTIIQENITYPARAQRMGWQGKVIVDFIITKNGKATDIKIIQSSGFDVLDDNVVKTVEAVAPFPMPPVTAELRVPIIYKLD
jgi:periplasmic protein TonB